MPLFLIPIVEKILGFFGIIKSWKPSVLQIVLIISLLGNIFYHFRIEGIHIRPHIGPIHFTLVDVKGFKEIEVELRAVNKKIIGEGEKNHQQQIEVNNAPKVASQNVSEAVNDISDKSRKDIDQAVKNYIAAHPVRRTNCVPGKTDSVLSGQTGVSGTDSSTTGGNQEDVVPDMVSVSVDDFNHYNDNTKDLGELRAYIAKMIELGIFVPFDKSKP